MQKKHMERCLFALIVLLIFALTIFGLYRVTKHSAAPASTTIPVVSPATSPADVPTATFSPTPEPAPSPTPTPPDRVDSYAVQGAEVASHQSDTMHWRIERIEQEGAVCYLTKIYLLDPGTQIRKATANWERDIQYPVDMAAKIPDATLFINGSGYVSPTFPEIPSNYPGSSPDYYYTPLGSVTVTDGQVFRCLTGVPYYGLSLTRDGLHMHVGDDPADVLAANPTQTWSFYIECPVIRDHQSILDPNWRFTTAPAMRTIISCIDEHNFILLTVTRDGSSALTMRQCVDYLQSAFDPLWTYNLDGGPSIALYYRLSPDDDWVRVAGGTSKDADIMAFAD